MITNLELDNDYLQKMFFEQECYKSGYSHIAGIDEVGRGPLAGPVVACACILPQNKIFHGINDSKQIKEKRRRELRDDLVADKDVFYGIGVVSVDRIDEINILEATKEAMCQAIERLSLTPDALLVDGLSLSFKNILSKKIIKGDERSVSIAAASIIAKEYRDDLMRELHERYPCYGFDKHKGYGTAKHLEALRLHGPCSEHRKSFAPVKNLLLGSSHG